MFGESRTYFLKLLRNNKYEKAQLKSWAYQSGATHEVRTRDLNLGKVALYQLS
ncbi:hypothetical protein IFVP5_C1360083 [Vibrio parahaemolyticus]